MRKRNHNWSFNAQLGNLFPVSLAICRLLALLKGCKREGWVPASATTVTSNQDSHSLKLPLPKTPAAIPFSHATVILPQGEPLEIWTSDQMLLLLLPSHFGSVRLCATP